MGKICKKNKVWAFIYGLYYLFFLFPLLCLWSKGSEGLRVNEARAQMSAVQS